MANQTKMVLAAETVVISHAAALASAANTYPGLTGLTLAQLNNSVDLYPLAMAVIEIPDTFAAAPTAGKTIDLFIHEEDVVNTTDDETPVPGATDIDYLGKYVGSWVMDNQDVATIKKITISLEGVRKAKFQIKNSLDQALSYSSNPIKVTITPFTYGPA